MMYKRFRHEDEVIIEPTSIRKLKGLSKPYWNY